MQRQFRYLLSTVVLAGDGGCYPSTSCRALSGLFTNPQTGRCFQISFLDSQKEPLQTACCSHLSALPHAFSFRAPFEQISSQPLSLVWQCQPALGTTLRADCVRLKETALELASAKHGISIMRNQIGSEHPVRLLGGTLDHRVRKETK